MRAVVDCSEPNRAFEEVSEPVGIPPASRGTVRKTGTSRLYLQYQRQRGGHAGIVGDEGERRTMPIDNIGHFRLISVSAKTQSLS